MRLNRMPAYALSCHKWHVSHKVCIRTPKACSQSLSQLGRQLWSVFQMFPFVR